MIEVGLGFIINNCLLYTKRSITGLSPGWKYNENLIGFPKGHYEFSEYLTNSYPRFRVLYDPYNSKHIIYITANKIDHIKEIAKVFNCNTYEVKTNKHYNNTLLKD